MLRKIALICLSVVLFASSAFALDAPKTANWVYTIKNTNVEEVQAVAIDVFVENLFDVGEVTKFRMSFTKSFDDIITSSYHLVNLNLVPKGKNVRVSVSQSSVGGGVLGVLNTGKKGNISHLVPLLKEIKHTIDGTPYDRIENEVSTAKSRAAKNKAKGNTADMKFKDTSDGVAEVKARKQGEIFVETARVAPSTPKDAPAPKAKQPAKPAPKAKVKEAPKAKEPAPKAPVQETPAAEAEETENLAGLILVPNRTTIGHLIVDGVVPGSRAEAAGLQAGDKITDINLGGTQGFDGPQAINYMNGRLSKKLNITITYLRDGNAGRTTIKY